MRFYIKIYLNIQNILNIIDVISENILQIHDLNIIIIRIHVYWIQKFYFNNYKIEL